MDSSDLTRRTQGKINLIGYQNMLNKRDGTLGSTYNSVLQKDVSGCVFSSCGFYQGSSPCVTTYNSYETLNNVNNGLVACKYVSTLHQKFTAPYGQVSSLTLSTPYSSLSSMSSFTNSLIGKSISTQIICSQCQ